MNFELLPNEILLDLFDYFEGNDLFHAFYGLNYRFNYLLYNQHRAFRFYFKIESKKSQIEMIRQQHLPNIIDRVIALHLHSDTLTIKELDIIFSYIPSLDQFIHLRSLSLSTFYTYELIVKILDECHQLPDLICLKFHSCGFSRYPTKFQSIIDNIWSLPKLIHCRIDIFMVNVRRVKFCTPTKISSSLESVHLIKGMFKFNEISQLLECTPRLKHLTIAIHNYNTDCVPTLFPTLISLKIHIAHINNISEIIGLLQNMSNLRRLNMHIISEMGDSNQLKQIIMNYFPKLKIFQFQMSSRNHFIVNISKHIQWMSTG